MPETDGPIHVAIVREVAAEASDEGERNLGRQLRVAEVAQAVLGQQRRVPIAGHQVSGMPNDPPNRVRCLHLGQRAPAPPAARRRIRVRVLAHLLRPHLIRPVVQPAHDTPPRKVGGR